MIKYILDYFTKPFSSNRSVKTTEAYSFKDETPKLTTDVVFCSFDTYEYVKSRYTKRKIYPSAYVPNNTFYYYTKTGEIRVCVNSNQIFSYLKDGNIIRRR